MKLTKSSFKENEPSFGVSAKEGEISAGFPILIPMISSKSGSTVGRDFDFKV